MIKPLFQNVLVMVNGTEASINAVKYAVLMARLYRSRVYALYVVDTATIKQLALNKIFVDEESAAYERSLAENGERYLRYVEEIGKAKGVRIETELRRGAIWSETIAMADERKIDAILIGSYDASSCEQKEIASTTFKSVLLNARCSVLVVKERMIEQLYKLA
jgi:nucleotide-binding universal stress UspA family protein